MDKKYKVYFLVILIGITIGAVAAIVGLLVGLLAAEIITIGMGPLAQLPQYLVFTIGAIIVQNGFFHFLLRYAVIISISITLAGSLFGYLKKKNISASIRTSIGAGFVAAIIIALLVNPAISFYISNYW